MWTILKRVKTLFHNEGCSNINEENTISSSEFKTLYKTEIEKLTSLQNLSDLIRFIHERRMAYLDDNLPCVNICLRCDTYADWVGHLYEQNGYFLSIIDVFENRIIMLTAEDKCKDFPRAAENGNTVDIEKYRGLKLKYFHLKSQHNVLKEGRDLTVESYQTDIDRLIKENKALKTQINILREENRTLHETIEEKDGKISEFKIELGKLVRQYDMFKAKVKQEYKDLLNSYKTDRARQSEISCKGNLKDGNDERKLRNKKDNDKSNRQRSERITQQTWTRRSKSVQTVGEMNVYFQNETYQVSSSLSYE